MRCWWPSGPHLELGQEPGAPIPRGGGACQAVGAALGREVPGRHGDSVVLEDWAFAQRFSKRSHVLGHLHCGAEPGREGGRAREAQGDRDGEDPSGDAGACRQSQPHLVTGCVWLVCARGAGGGWRTLRVFCVPAWTAHLSSRGNPVNRGPRWTFSGQKAWRLAPDRPAPLGPWSASGVPAECCSCLRVFLTATSSGPSSWNSLGRPA